MTLPFATHGEELTISDLESWIPLLEMFSDRHVMLHGAAGENAMDVGDVLKIIRSHIVCRAVTNLCCRNQTARSETAPHDGPTFPNCGCKNICRFCNALNEKKDSTWIVHPDCASSYALASRSAIEPKWEASEDTSADLLAAAGGVRLWWCNGRLYDVTYPQIYWWRKSEPTPPPSRKEPK